METVGTPALRKFLDVGRTMWIMHGLRAPAVVFSRMLFYIYCIIFRRGESFPYAGRMYQYAFHLDNVTFRCERAVEIPIALETYSLNGQVLELGNVLSRYFHFEHDIVDKYEKSPGVINEDIVTYAPGKLYDLILSVSTLEHVGWDETPKYPEKLLPAFDNLKRLLRPGGKLLATVPLGYNDFLDDCLKRDSFGLTAVSFMKRVSRTNKWSSTNRDDAMIRIYGSEYPCGNAIAVVIYEKPVA